MGVLGLAPPKQCIDRQPKWHVALGGSLLSPLCSPLQPGVCFCGNCNFSWCARWGRAHIHTTYIPSLPPCPARHPPPLTRAAEPNSRLANEPYFVRLLDIIRDPIGRPLLGALAEAHDRLAAIILLAPPRPEQLDPAMGPVPAQPQSECLGGEWVCGGEGRRGGVRCSWARCCGPWLRSRRASLWVVLGVGGAVV